MINAKDNITWFDRNVIVKLHDISRLADVKKVVSNWPMVLLFRSGIIKNFDIHLVNGTKVHIDNIPDYINFWKSLEVSNLIAESDGLNESKISIKKNTIDFIFKGKRITFYYDSDETLSWLITTARYGFLRYGIDTGYKLEVKNKDVVEIGGSLGETAIYFAIFGAKHVYSFEPYPNSYHIMEKNIKLNNLYKKIIPFNEAVGKRNDIVIIDPDYKSTDGDDLKRSKKGKRIKIRTLAYIVDKLDIHDGILKMNCEGDEYKIILSSKSRDLRRFKEMKIDYHYGYINLIKKLKSAGFKVNYTRPGYVLNIFAKNKDMYGGYIFAQRI